MDEQMGPAAARFPEMAELRLVELQTAAVDVHGRIIRGAVKLVALQHVDSYGLVCPAHGRCAPVEHR